MLSKILSFERLMSASIPALLVAVVLAVVMVGCFGDFAPMAPGNDDVKVEQPHWLTYDMPDQVGAAKAVTASATINRLTGGSLSVVNGGLVVSFSVPPQPLWGASVTISMSVDEVGKVIIDFGPDGTLFLPVATLTVKGASLSGSTVALYLWNPLLNQWIELDTPVGIGSDGTLTTTIAHFSRYGMADKN